MEMFFVIEVSALFAERLQTCKKRCNPTRKHVFLKNQRIDAQMRISACKCSTQSKHFERLSNRDPEIEGKWRLGGGTSGGTRLLRLTDPHRT